MGDRVFSLFALCSRDGRMDLSKNRVRPASRGMPPASLWLKVRGIPYPCSGKKSGIAHWRQDLDIVLNLSTIVLNYENTPLSFHADALEIEKRSACAFFSESGGDLLSARAWPEA